MSIWATLWHADADWHDPDCAVWAKDSNGVYYTDPNRACDRWCGPIVYQASHLWPDPSARVGIGGVEIAAISTELTPDGRDEGTGDGYHPWLRLAVNRELVILDRAQVQRLHGALGDWLGRTEVDSPGTCTDSGTQARR